MTSRQELDRVQNQLADALMRAKALGMTSRPPLALLEPTGIRVAPQDSQFVERRAS